MDAFKPTGIGAVAAKNVFKLVFSEDLSAVPKLKAWDNYNMNSVLHKIFIGCTQNGDLPMIGGIGLTAAPAASWWPTTKTVGAAVGTGSLLMGNTGFCQLAAAAPSALDELFFNLNYKFPVPTGTPPNTDPKPSDTWSHVIACEYEYTGDPPDLSAYGNDGGTEGSPSWTALTLGLKGYAPTPGVARVRPVDAGNGPDGTDSMLFTFPDDVASHPDEIWVDEYEA